MSDSFRQWRKEITSSFKKGEVIFVALFLAINLSIFSGYVSAACSAYKNRAVINEVHKSGNNTRFLEVKLLDSNITAATYDGWTLTTCTIAGCTSNSLSDGNDSGLPYIVIEKPDLPDRNRIPLGDGTGEGGDILLTDAFGNTIDYFSVNDFQNEWWGWNNQYDASCTSAYDWEYPGTNTHTIAREPDGTGDWSDSAGNSGGSTESDTNDTDPPPGGGTLEILSTADVSVNAGSDATFTISLSNAPTAYDVSFSYFTIDNTAVASTDYTATTGSATILAGDTDVVVAVPTLGGSAGGVSFYFFILNPVNATIVSHVGIGSINASVGADHFLISYAGNNNAGIHCLAKSVTVTAKNSDGSDDTTYTGSVTLNTQSTDGNWTLNTGDGTFADATADDGLATYTFDAADNGVAVFDLNYQVGTPSIDVDVDDGSISDDDTEGNLVFSPSGFTVTASPLNNPPSLPIDLSIPVQTAAVGFDLYLTAYGTTPTDSTCGVIESYDGVKALGFWSTYMNPLSGTQAMTVDAGGVATSQAGVAGTRNVTFTQGQAQIAVDYPDVGAMALAIRDNSTGNPDLPAGIFGTSQNFVVQPADFELVITRTSDGFANPGTATNENGAAFIAAGDDFTVQVKVVNALGVATPNYGRETVPESILLVPTLVAGGSTNNPPIESAIGFDGFVSGVDTGTDFHWDEVGIITLTPFAATLAERAARTPGTYLGVGNITPTTSVNVGRFYPGHFDTAVTPGSFNNACTTFNYLGQNFDYLTKPEVIVSAKSNHTHAPDDPLGNYTGVWARLGVGGVTLTYPTADNAQLDEGGILPIGVTSAPGTLGRVDNGDGTLTFTLGGAAADDFGYVRSAGEVSPFTSDLTIQLTAVTDGEASANAANLSPARDITPIGNAQRFGRGYAQDVHGTMSQNGESLTVPIGSWYFDASGAWVVNVDDSCSSYVYVKTDNGITTSTPVASPSPVTLSAGSGDLVLTINGDAGPPGGTSVITTTWPSWLQYNIDDVDQLLDGNFYDDNPSATATFGIFRGDDRYLYWRESP